MAVEVVSTMTIHRWDPLNHLSLCCLPLGLFFFWMPKLPGPHDAWGCCYQFFLRNGIVNGLYDFGDRGYVVRRGFVVAESGRPILLPLEPPLLFVIAVAFDDATVELLIQALHR